MTTIETRQHMREDFCCVSTSQLVLCPSKVALVLVYWMECKAEAARRCSD